MILEAEGLSWKARLMALVLMDHMNGDGGSCFPSLTTLSRESGCARSTVCAGLDELDRGDYISRRRGGPKTGATRYLATSPHDGLGVVRTADLGSPSGEPEGVHEDAHNFSRRASRARKKKRAPKTARFPDLTAYDE